LVKEVLNGELGQVDVPFRGFVSGWFVRFFDRKVARLVSYRDARANYAMLQEIPARLREHAKNKQSEAAAAKERLAGVERQALVADGIEALERRAAGAHSAMKAAEDSVAKITAQLQEIEADRQKAVGTRNDAVYDRAVDLLAQALAREDLRQLYQEAARTATTVGRGAEAPPPEGVACRMLQSIATPIATLCDAPTVGGAFWAAHDARVRAITAEVHARWARMAQRGGG
jgi:hypothetical protein